MILDPPMRFWRGGAPLGRAVWGWAVLGGVLVNASTTAIFLTLVTWGLPVLAWVVGYALSIPYNVFAMVGVWRAADRHEGERAVAEIARYAALAWLIVLSVT
ncbi:MAG: hypothetical protein RLO50_13830 [Azospirillaceae bacterium]